MKMVRISSGVSDDRRDFVVWFLFIPTVNTKADRELQNINLPSVIGDVDV